VRGGGMSGFLKVGKTNSVQQTADSVRATQQAKRLRERSCSRPRIGSVPVTLPGIGAPQDD
jgi:hypothetical protein